MTLVEFLKARLRDDEAYARNAFGDHNDAEPGWHEIWSGELALNAAATETLNTGDSQVSRFIARHDPARVLREVEAKRQIVDLCATETSETGGLPLALRTLRALALPYSDLTEYDEAWRPA